MLRVIVYSLVFAVFLACKPQKEITKVDAPLDEISIQLDTLNVLSGKSAEIIKYQVSNPRVSDILHTKLEVDFDWPNSRMNGRATVLLKPYFYPIDWCYLNARGMEIKKVDVYEIINTLEKKGTTSMQVEERIYLSRAGYVYENDSIKINLGQVFYNTQKFEVRIEYISKPNELKNTGGSAAISQDKGLYFINPKGENPFKMPQIWTQGETQSNSVWFPTIDSPNERMTQEILINVEEKYTTLSNGVLVNSTKMAGGTRVDHWKLDSPHAPYLAMMAIGEFVKIVDEPWSGKEISYYVEKEYAPYAKEIFGDTKEMIEFFSSKLGVPYAWPKYAQIAVRDYVSGAMENTSATLHGDFIVYQKSRDMIDRNKATDVISHELFHQWFGDLVTCESWSNLPLNESFATYGEYLWREYKDGRDAADDHSYQSRQGYKQSEKEANLIRYNYMDKEDMFDAISYNKGGQVLHMLRKAVGDEAFFTGLKKYLEDNRFQPVEIQHLRLAFEEVTGEDLNWFFNQWFLNKGRPNLKITAKQNNSTSIELKVEQKQDLSNAPLYRLPIDIDLYTKGKTERKRIIITEPSQTFTFLTRDSILLLNFDAERQLLCDLVFEKTTPQYLFQYQNAPLYGDRLEALMALEEKLDEADVRNLFFMAAQQDKFFELRMFAINQLEKQTKGVDAELKTLFTNIYYNDKSTLTKASALRALNKRYGADAEVLMLNEKAMQEKSYAICGEAFSAFAKREPEKAMVLAKQFENESGKELVFTIAALYSRFGGDDQALFFHNTLPTISGFEIMSFCSSYSKTAQKFKLSSNALMAAKDFEFIGIDANKYIKFITKKCLQELVNVWDIKEKQAAKEVEMAKSQNKLSPELEASYNEILATRTKMEEGLSRIK